MSAPQNRFLLGQRPRRAYLNRFTELFFTELDKGLASPLIFFPSGLLIAYIAWHTFEKRLRPWQKIHEGRQTLTRVHFDPQHNARWGLENAYREGPLRGFGTGRYAVQSETVEKEDELERPVLIASETSALKANNRGDDMEVLCMELQEFDPLLKGDAYYRSIHYVGDTSPPSAKNKPQAQSSVNEVIHGIVKCRSISSKNNCVPVAGHVESEIARKLALVLGPVHVVRDGLKVAAPIRFSFVKEVPLETLVLGLHGGEFSRWLSRSFPNFNVTVVESDATLIRLCRHLLGMQESSNLHVLLDNPTDHIRRVAAQLSSDSHTVKGDDAPKRYDLVVVDALDGTGHISTQYSRLEFLNDVRNVMSRQGCVAVTLPNTDADYIYHAVQNWRMAFSGRPVLLVHCATSPVTVLMTFQDHARTGSANMGSVANVDEFQDLLRAKLSHYGSNRIAFDITREVNADNFVVLQPGRVYDRELFVPAGHPAMELEKKPKSSNTSSSSWTAWLRRAPS